SNDIWVGQISAAGLVLTDELVKSKDRKFENLFGILEDELKFSNRWLRHIDSEFCIQDRKILLLVDNAPSHSLPESFNNTNKILSINNIEVDDYQLNSENEDLRDDFLGFRNDDETEGSFEKQQKGQCKSTCRRLHGSTCGRLYENTSRRLCKSTSRRPRRSTNGKLHRSTHERPCGNTYKRTKTNTNSSYKQNKELSKTLRLMNITLNYLLPHTTAHIQLMDAEQTKILLNTNEPDMDIVDQPAEGDILLENNKIEEIVAKLPDESSYVPETAQAITTYLQIIDEPVFTEKILNNKKIIFIVQADENKESVRQEIDDEDKEISESNFSIKELGFLKNLLKEYKHIYEKSKKQKKITSFFNFQDSHSYDSYPQDTYSQDLYFQDSYSQDSYPQDLYSQDSYFQDSYSQNLYSQNLYFQNLYSQESDLQESDSQELDFQKLDS
ncbi:27727_t:CDS:2, partial [Gigaspora margarita]